VVKEKVLKIPDLPVGIYSYGKKSRARLATCHPDLQLIFNTAIYYMDISIIEGERSKMRQNSLFKKGKSKLKYPASKHNIKPGEKYSMAVDAAPHPIDWKELNRFYMFVGRIKQIAALLYREGYIEHKLRCGADWDMDGWTNDQKFHDIVHFELIGNKK